MCLSTAHRLVFFPPFILTVKSVVLFWTKGMAHKCPVSLKLIVIIFYYQLNCILNYMLFSQSIV